MDAKLRAQMTLKAWPERTETTLAMLKAIENGDIVKTEEILSKFPLIDHWVPYSAECWSELAAAAGQLELMLFWRKREQTTRSARKQASLESLLFCAMGEDNDHVRSTEGVAIRVAEYLLDHGASIEGNIKDYSPLHRAVFKNRPEIVELLIRRGANLSRRYVTGESALQIAKRLLMEAEQNDGGESASQIARRISLASECVKLLEQAGAPLELPKKPERPKLVRTVDLRQSAKKLAMKIEQAVRSFARKHHRETVTAIALASVPHEAYVMVSFDTGKFEKSPWDCTFDEFAYVKFPDWRQAHELNLMRLIDVDGKESVKEPDAFCSRFKQMIVGVLMDLERKGLFDLLTTAKGCQIGVEMTVAGEGKFWRLRKGE
ncbi:MAG: hypothetical protein FWD53_08760 [Phycisphaerales bacterium]|nr:hypothetical protein [Phycisphaerales bacterium]